MSIVFKYELIITKCRMRIEELRQVGLRFLFRFPLSRKYFTIFEITILNELINDSNDNNYSLHFIWQNTNFIPIWKYIKFPVDVASLLFFVTLTAIRRFMLRKDIIAYILFKQEDWSTASFSNLVFLVLRSEKVALV